MMKSPTEFLQFFVVKTTDPTQPQTPQPFLFCIVGYGVICNNWMTQSLIMCRFVLWLLIDVRYALDTQLIAFHQLYITNSVYDH